MLMSVLLTAKVAGFPTHHWHIGWISLAFPLGRPAGAVRPFIHTSRATTCHEMEDKISAHLFTFGNLFYPCTILADLFTKYIAEITYHICCTTSCNSLTCRQGWFCSNRDWPRKDSSHGYRHRPQAVRASLSTCTVGWVLGCPAEKYFRI